MEQTTTIKTTAAKRVLDVFPTPSQILTDPKYKADKVIHPLMRFAWANQDNDWEAIAITVNNMCMSAQDRPFSEYFQPHLKKGSVECLDYSSKKYKVTFEEFKALNLIMYCSWMAIEFSDEMRDAYLDFRSSDPKIYWILD